MRPQRYLFLFALMFASLARVSAQIPVADDRYRIGFQDVLDVQIYRHPELNQKVAVNANGTIVLFRIEKPVVAVCKTERELADEISAAYTEKVLKNALVNVVVSEQKSQPVAVIGAVEKPGSFFVNRRVHLLEMLALAGGPNKESGTRLIVMRSGNASSCKRAGDPVSDDAAVLADFKIRDVQEGKATYWMQPGDIVSVLDADIIYVYGNVNKQGIVKVREPITLTQAIVSAEGFKPATKRDKVRVLRKASGTTEREELIFDLNAIDKGKIRDPYLEPNDIVAVSEDKTKAILRGLMDSVRNSVPNVLYRFP
ncbi:MAG: SLBB domain-containing protein [Pyrinomonadaceae bacterium]